MHIIDLLSTESIALDFPVENQAQVIDKLISLQVTHGNITDVAAYKKAIYARETEASTYVDFGITLPHEKCNCVTKPSLATSDLRTVKKAN
jgi:PTS system fructose-specific IIC component